MDFQNDAGSWNYPVIRKDLSADRISADKSRYLKQNQIITYQYVDPATHLC